MKPSSLNPFDDFRALLQTLPAADFIARTEAGNQQKKLAGIGKTTGLLGDIAVWYAGWRGQSKPLVTRPLVAVFAGNHGVVEENISILPQDATRQMVDNFAAGGAVVNQVCITHDLGLKIYDLALDYPTMDIAKDAAMDERGCAATMAFGMEAIAGGTDLLCLGDMGVGNSTVAAAVALALFGGEVEDWLDTADPYFPRKAEVIRAALALHQNHLQDPFEVLRRLGGREFAAIVGAILAARIEKIPVILDGFVTTAAAAVLFKLHPLALEHCIAGYASAEAGQRKLLEKLEKKPLLDLGSQLNGGVGAALAAGLVKAAVLANAQSVPFEQAVTQGATVQ